MLAAGPPAHPPQKMQDNTRQRPTFAQEIVGLDEQIVALLAKRTSLVAKARRAAKSQADARSDAEREKHLRQAWEAATAKTGLDPKLWRSIFNALQEMSRSSRAGLGQDLLRP